MDDMITSIITQLVYAAITFAMGYSWNKSRSLAAIQKNMEKGIGLLLRRELHDYHKIAKRRGYLTYREERDAEEIYSVYAGLNMNGYGTTLITEIRKFPKKEVSENAKMVTRDIPKTHQ